jgi:hypothetical protein
MAGGNEFERIRMLRLRDHFSSMVFGTRRAAHFEASRRRQADERVTAEAFPALHGFQQIGIRLVGELEVN